MTAPSAGAGEAAEPAEDDDAQHPADPHVVRVGHELVEHRQRGAAEAGRRAPMANICAIVRSTSIPTSAALSRLVAQARIARPRNVQRSSAQSAAKITTAPAHAYSCAFGITRPEPISNEVLKYDGVAARASVPQISDISPPAATATANDATSVSSGSIRCMRAMTNR